MIYLPNKKLALVALALTVTLAVIFTPALKIDAADHGDAPYNGSDQAIDGADVYAFLDPTDTSCPAAPTCRVILGFTSRGFIAAGENNNFGQFDPAVRYRFELETTGDPRPDRFITVTFTRKTGATAPQTATVTLLNGQTFTAPTTPSSLCIAGSSASCPPAPAITEFTSSSGLVRFFAGMRDDTFNFDIPGFANGSAALRACVSGANTSSTCVADALAILGRGRDSFAGYNVMNIVLSLPKAIFGTPANNEIGINGTLARRSPTRFIASPDQVAPGRNYPSVGFGEWVQLDRNGIPGISATLIPFARKDEFNAISTQDDANGRFADAIVAALRALGTTGEPSDPTTPIGVLASVAVLRGDQLRLNLNTANTSLGVGETIQTTGYTGFPNGRRPYDDVVDVLLFFVANRQPITDNANVNEVPALNTFPFFPPPHQPRPKDTGAEDLTRN